MSNTPSFASAPPCELDKILIEVTGIDHDDTQSIVFYDQDDTIEQEALGQKQEKGLWNDSVLHKWQPDNDTPVNA